MSQHCQAPESFPDASMIPLCLLSESGCLAHKPASRHRQSSEKAGARAPNTRAATCSTIAFKQILAHRELQLGAASRPSQAYASSARVKNQDTAALPRGPAARESRNSRIGPGACRQYEWRHQGWQLSGRRVGVGKTFKVWVFNWRHQDACRQVGTRIVC